MKSTFNRSVVALAAIFAVAGASQAAAQDKPLKKYESGTKEFWTNPPDDWSRLKLKRASHHHRVRRPAHRRPTSPR